MQQLLEDHLEDMHRFSPPESVHALDLEQPWKAEITFWSVWNGKDLLGCGALKQLGPDHGEIKSMRTAKAHRREGVASALLAHILAVAKEWKYRRISLETGSMEEFAPSRKLYSKFGLRICSL